MTSTTVSCKGDKRYRSALKTLAERRRTSMAKLVREALDAMYGSEIEDITSLFFADDVKQKQHTETSAP